MTQDGATADGLPSGFSLGGQRTMQGRISKSGDLWIFLGSPRSISQVNKEYAHYLALEYIQTFVEYRLIVLEDLVAAYEDADGNLDPESNYGKVTIGKWVRNQTTLGGTDIEWSGDIRKLVEEFGVYKPPTD